MSPYPTVKAVTVARYKDATYLVAQSESSKLYLINQQLLIS